MRRRAGAVLSVLASCAVLVVAPAAGASAHNQLVSTDPADGATVASAPAQVVLTFDQPAIALGSRVIVTGPDGATVSAGEPRLVDSDVTQDLAGDLPAGRYQVQWRVTSADGHPVEGGWTFTASGPGTGAAGPAPADVAADAPADVAGLPRAVLVPAAAVAGAGLAVTAVIALQRRRTAGHPSTRR